MVDGQGQAQLVPVNTAELVNSQYRITSGLNAGQRVVIEGIDRLTPGTQVIAHPWQSPPSASRLTPVTVESETFHAAVFIHRPVFAWVLALFIVLAGSSPSPSCPSPAIPRWRRCR